MCAYKQALFLGEEKTVFSIYAGRYTSMEIRSVPTNAHRKHIVLQSQEQNLLFECTEGGGVSNQLSVVLHLVILEYLPSTLTSFKTMCYNKE